MAFNYKFLVSAFLSAALLGCGGGGGDSGGERSSELSELQQAVSSRIATQGITTSTADGVYFVTDVFATSVGTDLNNGRQVSSVEYFGIDAADIDFGANQIRLALGNFFNLEVEEDFFVEPFIFARDGQNNFIENDLNSDFDYVLIAANEDGAIYEVNFIDDAANADITVTVTLDYERAGADYEEFIGNLDQFAEPLDSSYQLGRLDIGLFSYTNDTNETQTIRADVGGFESGSFGETVVSAFFEVNEPSFDGEIDFIDSVILNTNNTSENLIQVFPGERIFITYEFTEYEPADNVEGQALLDFYEDESFTLSFSNFISNL